ncbi:MetQ/NlpA family ABC transporter substrate-binding protein [Burkholderia gladioli]|uniref:Lipoprotein n=2 Tax=Burkholderia gladioli TaxID=28095 RepID=A0AB38U3L0_BURGA|nr:MetQ/NlpA family ABC transporter substrate-binding protein [Burkholderia gladioli]MBU9273543.1 MetQ/NlpA family ABC transporter substrate-binding protein [Burkholderia gladioli]MCA8168641.1 MetQ/NlpA family ABC transporter substrate-binding protein [Burkholderia gladioli]UWX74559.1 MetQ/NlpA family ABC transporter substrate-binding protein [Burkholderia gladioli]
MRRSFMTEEGIAMRRFSGWFAQVSRLAVVGGTLSVALMSAARADGTPLRIGTMSGPDAQIWAEVAKVAAHDGLPIKVIEFNDYVQPNAALDSGDLDANGFQHQPFLDSQIKQRGYRIVSVGLTYTAPMGFYSRKVKSLKDLPVGAKVGIQNDPSNGNRALLLLQKYGVIKLKPGVGSNGVNATPLDVAENPKKIRIVELDSAQLPRALPDLDAASINTDYAVKAGLTPVKDAIAIEDLKGPYANLIAVRAQDRDKPWVKKLVAAYESDDVRKFIDAKFNGAIVPAF